MQMTQYRIWADTSNRYVKLNRSVKKSLNIDRDTFFDDIAAQADKEAERGDNKKIYEFSKRVGNVQTKSLKVVYKKDGTLTTNDYEYDERFQEHFQEVFTATKVEQLEEIKVRPELEPHKVGFRKLDAPTVEDLSSALKKQKAGKAVG